MRKWHELSIIFIRGILLHENSVYKVFLLCTQLFIAVISLQGGHVSAKKTSLYHQVRIHGQNIGRVSGCIRVFSRDEVSYLDHKNV
jgi:hypothetical protein